MADTEKIALWMIKRGYATGHGDTVEDLLGELEAVVLEKAARIAENFNKFGTCIAVAAAIRAAKEG